MSFIFECDASRELLSLARELSSFALHVCGQGLAFLIWASQLCAVSPPLRSYQRQGGWMESYINSSILLNLSDHPAVPFLS